MAKRIKEDSKVIGKIKGSRLLMSLLTLGALACTLKVLAGGPTIFPNDVAFLFDDIGLELTLKEGAQFSVGIKPFSLLRISISSGRDPDLIKYFGLVVVPEIDGAPAAHSEVEAANLNEITYSLVPICLADSRIDVIFTDFDCPSTLATVPFDSLGVSLRSRERISGLKAGEEAVLMGGRFAIRLTDYRTNSRPNDRYMPLGVCCRKLGTVEVCGCSVAILTSSCTAGCALRPFPPDASQ